MAAEDSTVVLLVDGDDASAGLVIKNFGRTDVPHQVRRFTDYTAAMENLKNCINNPNSEQTIKPRLIIISVDKFAGVVEQFIQFIKDHIELKRIPVLVFAGLDDDQAIKRAYGLKVNSYLVRPSDENEFAKVIFEVASYWLKWNQLPT